ncbi:NUDIX hydrolase [Cryomorphaceae bacterium]|nr:NUDIX hydrolase [Cryomorphaceae bacterium]
MNYCSHCGSSRLDFTIPEGDNRLRFVCQNCGRIHYQNPRMIVGCLPLWKGHILLARRNIEPRFGLWNLPSGFLENGETVEEGALRELHEETHATGRIIRPHAVYNLPHANQVYLHFLVELDSDHYELTPESSEIAFFSPENIPFEDMAFSSSTFSIKKHLEYPDGPASGVHIGAYTKTF